MITCNSNGQLVAYLFTIDLVFWSMNAALVASVSWLLLYNWFSGRICPFTGKKTNRANNVSHSNTKTKKLQYVNLQYKRIWWEGGKRWVKLRLSTKALKTIEKNGLDAVAKKAGVDLRKKWRRVCLFVLPNSVGRRKHHLLHALFHDIAFLWYSSLLNSSSFSVNGKPR